MTKNNIFSIALLLTSLKLFAAPSGESANPFSQFTDPSGGVSLFTGSAAYSHPLLTLSTRGALSLPVSLAYSANVELNARADNEIAPTSWIGLGWRLGFGKIVCNHKNTMSLNDDDYTWISPEGVAYPIYSGGTSFHVKDRMYVKIERYAEGDYVRGWKIKDESGNIYKYGVCYNDDDSYGDFQSANNSWYTLCWDEEGYVGTGFWGEPHPYPYQWNLSEMSDVYGNWIRFDYAAIAGNVSYNDTVASPPLAWQPADSLYTKELYIERITTNNGTTVFFEREAKTADEYVVPAEGQATGKEISQPVYETRRLKRITVTNSHSSLPYALKIDFHTTFIGSDTFKKALLSKIVVENGKADNGVRGKTVTWFDYYTDENDPTGCYGAMKSVRNNAGAENVWQYEKLQFDDVERKLQVDNFTISFSNMKTGTTGDGEDYYLFVNAWKNRIWVVKWCEDHWERKVIEITEGDVVAEPGPGYFLVRYGTDTRNLKVYGWDGENWTEETCVFDGSGTFEKIEKMSAFAGHFALRVERAGIYFILNYLRDPYSHEWHGNSLSEFYTDEASLCFGPRYITANNIDESRYDKFDYYTWNGSGYSNLRSSVTRKKVGKIFPGWDVFVEEDDDDDDEYYAAYRYNGTNWQSRMFNEDGDSTLYGDRVLVDTRHSNIAFGNDFFILSDEDDGNLSFFVYNWLGYIWKKTRQQEKRNTVPIGGKSFADVSDGNGYTIWKWDDKTSRWSGGDYGSDVYVGGSFKFGVGGQFQVAATKNDQNYYSKINIWDGKGWTGEQIVDNFGTVATPRNMGEYTVVCGSSSFVLMAVDNDRSSGIGEKVCSFIFHRKFQNSFCNPAYSHVVGKKTVRNGIDDKAVTTRFVYEEPVYNASLGTAMFGRVTVLQDGGGKVVNEFETAVYRKKGTLKKTTSYKNFGTAAAPDYKVQAEQSTAYEIYTPYGSGSVFSNVYQKRPTSVTSSAAGNISVKTLEYDNGNGIVNKTTEINSDGTYRITGQLFAYHYYADLDRWNMIAQPFGTKVWYKADESSTPLVAASNVSTWNVVPVENGGCFTVPSTGYTWKVPMTDAGLPSSDPQYAYADFDINLTSNPNWYGGGHVTLLDEWKRPIESVDVNGVYSTVINGNKGYRPIARIGNAQFRECAVYTCNYNENYTDPSTGIIYLDYRNGWERCGAQCDEAGIPADAKGHFSPKTVYIDLPAVPNGFYGPSRNVKVDTAKNYVLSAWVYVVEGIFVLGGDYRWITDQTVPYSAGAQMDTFTVPFDSVTSTGTWQLAKLTIPVSSDLAGKAGNWGIRLFAGAPNGVKAYLDDIRFYPEDATIATSYYDENWRQVQVSVDNNDHPGIRTVYDGFGRPVCTQKIDPSKTFGASGYISAILQSKRYIIAEGGIAVKNPLEGSVIAVNDVVDMEFENYCEQAVSLYYTPPAGSRVLIATVTYNPANTGYVYHYAWTVPESLDEGEYKLTFQAVTDTGYTVVIDPVHVKKGKILYPTAGALLQTRTAEMVRYYFNAPSTATVVLSVNGTVITPPGTVNTGEFVWNIPPDYLDGSDGEERDSVVMTATCNGSTVSSEPFRIRRWSFIRRAALKLLNRIW